MITCSSEKETPCIHYIYIYLFFHFLSFSIYFFLLSSRKLISQNYEITNFPIRDPATVSSRSLNYRASIIYYLVTGLKEKKKKNYLIERVRHAKVEEEEEEEGEQVLLADGTLRLYRFHLSGSK